MPESLKSAAGPASAAMAAGIRTAAPSRLRQGPRQNASPSVDAGASLSDHFHAAVVLVVWVNKRSAVVLPERIIGGIWQALEAPTANRQSQLRRGRMFPKCRKRGLSQSSRKQQRKNN